MPCALDKIIMAEVGGSMQSQYLHSIYSRDKFKTSYHRNAYGGQTWQDSSLPWGAPTP